ncbi:MAG: class I SAM-dependent methyltransferase [Lachnospiraceae bacterium]|nr:class I SAM-dependent methyltransferase [Lachnospiraceae bacterium]
MEKINEKQKSEQKENLPSLVETEDGLALVSGELKLIGDYKELLPRIKGNRVKGELIVKAAKIKEDMGHPLVVFDATAGLGEDSFLLAAAGFQIILCEYNKVIFSLLEDTHKRALMEDSLKEAAERMKLINGNSLEILRSMEPHSIDVVLLDPMFPAKTKNSLTNKKLQLFQRLEMPCSLEEELFEAATFVQPKKIIVKRPLKGPFLCGKKPNHSISGKTVRYDCYLNV